MWKYRINVEFYSHYFYNINISYWITNIKLFNVPYFTDNTLLADHGDQIVVKQAAEISILAYLGYSIGLLLQSGRHRHIGSLQKINLRDSRLMRKGGQWVFLLGAVISVASIAFTTGFSKYLLAGYAGRSLLKQEVGPIEIGLYVSIIGLFSIFVANMISERKENLSKIFIAVIFIFFFLYISFLGIRRPFFLLGLGLLAGYSIVHHRPTLTRILPIALLAFFFLTTFSQYRQLISTVGIVETVVFIQDNASWKWLDVSTGELGAPFRTLTDYIRIDGVWRENLLGASYAQTPAYVLPSFLTGGIQSLSVKYTHTFFSDDFIGIGGNMGFSPVTEAFLNYGPIGVFFVFIIFGFGLGKANRWFYSIGRGRTAYIVLFMMLVPWTAFFMRLDMASFAKGFLYSQLVPFFILYLLLIFYKSRRRARY